jgi:hypothetical protein
MNVYDVRVKVYFSNSVKGEKNYYNDFMNSDYVNKFINTLAKNSNRIVIDRRESVKIIEIRAFLKEGL